MNKDNLEKNIQDTVMTKVRSGNVRVHSRAFFIARLVGTLVVAALAFVLSIFVVSFIFFSIHESGEQFLLGYGTAGVLTFLELFPWASLVLDIALLILLEWLLQGFKLGYRFSLLVIFIGIFGGSVLLGFLITLTPLHMILLGLADRGDLPLVGGVYESVHDSHAGHGVFNGVITSESGNQIVIVHQDKDHDGDDGVWNVTLPQGASSFQVGEQVYVFGELLNGVVVARGVQLLHPDPQ